MVGMDVDSNRRATDVWSMDSSCIANSIFMRCDESLADKYLYPSRAGSGLSLGFPGSVQVRYHCYQKVCFELGFACFSLVLASIQEPTARVRKWCGVVLDRVLMHVEIDRLS